MKKTILLKAAAPTQVILTQPQITEIVNYVNSYRALFPINPIVWDPTIATFSQNWANYLNSNNLFEHSGVSMYGENLAWFQGYTQDIITTIKLSVDLWFNEILLYNFNKPGFSEETGHFTQLMNATSTTFGIGYSLSTDQTTAIVVFNNYPQGNIEGMYQQNVLPPIAGVTIPHPTANLPVTVVSPPTVIPIPIPVVTCPTPVDTVLVDTISSLYSIIKDVQANKPKNTLISELKQLVLTLAQIESSSY